MNKPTPAQSGYTLPVFACASAIAAVETLLTGNCPDSVQVELLAPAITAEIPIDQGSLVDNQRALAITHSEPGDNLDLTRHTPIWAQGEFTDGQGELIIQGGEGIGRQIHRGGEAAIYGYAQRLLHHHLEPYLVREKNLVITLILPAGEHWPAVHPTPPLGLWKVYPFWVPAALPNP